MPILIIFRSLKVQIPLVADTERVPFRLDCCEEPELSKSSTEHVYAPLMDSILPESSSILATTLKAVSI